MGAAASAGLAAGAISLTALLQSGQFINMVARHRSVVRIPTRSGGVLKVKNRQLELARFGRYYDGAWYVKIDRRNRRGVLYDISGPDAQRVAALLLPRVNITGARHRHVSEAVGVIEEQGGSQAFINHLIEEPPFSDRRGYTPEQGLPFKYLPRTYRLAFEMALHEEQERQFLNGELRGLESAWHSAEEIAAIADDLLVPSGIRERLFRRPHPTDGSAA